MRRHVLLIAALGIAAMTAACGSASNSTEASRNGEIPTFDEPLAIDNPYLPFARRGRWVYDGTKNGALYRVEVEVTDETKLIDWSDGTESFETEIMVVRHRGWVDDQLIEETLEHIAQAEDGSVWYFGEDVDNYEDRACPDADNGPAPTCNAERWSVRTTSSLSRTWPVSG